MPDILATVEYSQELRALVDAKLNNPNFTYTNWSDDELLGLRSSVRKFYRNEQKGKCAYCKNPVSLQSASNCHVEHIVPKSLYLYFIFEPKNLCVVCADCNEIKREQETRGEIPDTLKNCAKRVLYPRSSSAFKIVHPHFDNYTEHIQIIGEYYMDKSLKGHFTIGACRLNRKLYQFGWEKEIVSESVVLDLMSSYIDDDNTIHRHKILNKLREILI